MGHRSANDWRAAASRAVDHTARIVAEGGYQRCEFVSDAGERCIYGAGHTLPTHGFDSPLAAK